MHRESDLTPKTRFRSDRFFCSEGLWFFNTREGTVEGPYESRSSAEAGLANHLLALGVKVADVWAAAGDNR